MKAYEEMIPEGVTPAYFIFLETDPHGIDVNIHPTKTEIKFEDDSLIFQILYACVKETLGRNSFGASIDFNTEGATPLPQLGGSFEQYKPVSMPVIETDPAYDPFREVPDQVRNDYGGAIPGPTGNLSRYIDKSQDYGRLFEENTLPLGRLLVLQGKYILTPAASGLMVVHIGRARERILYEQTLRALGRNAHVTQTALFPVQVQVGAQQRLLFEDSAALLAQLGFDIVPSGVDTVTVNGVPEGYSCESGKVEQLVSDLVYILSEDHDALSEMVQQRLAEKFAALGASHADPPASPQDAQRLIDTLFACDNAELTPGGRRIVSIVPIGDIDKRF
jgi:DNA mismatch repair enzyme (predicted ATPase)